MPVDVRSDLLDLYARMGRLEVADRLVQYLPLRLGRERVRKTQPVWARSSQCQSMSDRICSIFTPGWVASKSPIAWSNIFRSDSVVNVCAKRSRFGLGRVNASRCPLNANAPARKAAQHQVARLKVPRMGVRINTDSYIRFQTMARPVTGSNRWLFARSKQTETFWLGGTRSAAPSRATNAFDPVLR